MNNLDIIENTIKYVLTTFKMGLKLDGTDARLLEEALRIIKENRFNWENN